LKNIQLKTNIFNDSLIQENNSLEDYEILLRGTKNNINNKPIISSYLFVSFSFYVTNDSEILSFPRNTTLYANKKFIVIDNISTISGFNKTNSTLLSVSLFSQPDQSKRYTVNYSYIAPKQNERISITYNYNKVITDATIAINKNKTINEDILAKAALAIYVNITLYIVVTSQYAELAESVRQNVYDAIVSASSLTSLGSILDFSDIETAAGSIAGVDRVRITQFNKSGLIGSVLSIVSQKNEYILPGILNVYLETR
jgi:hypothetical protein